MTRFGKLLKRSRLKAGLTTRELGRISTYNHSHISRLEAGEALPSLEASWHIFAAIFGTRKDKFEKFRKAAYLDHKDRLAKEWGF